MKVLIVKTSALGDIVHALPVVNYLHSADARLTIDWLVEKPFAPLLEAKQSLRTIHIIDTKLWRQPGRLIDACAGIRNVVWSLRREKYDVVLDLQGNSKSGLFTFFSGAPLRYGFDNRSVREWLNLLATNRRVAITGMDHHITDRALRLAATAFPGGFLGPDSNSLSVDTVTLSEKRERIREAGVTGKKLVLMHPGTTWKTKCLSLDFWMQLAAVLNKNDEIFLLLSWGSKEELADVQKIKSQIPEGCLVWPRGELRELMALVAQVNVVIGGDTGPVHIAAALGTPTVSFYRATDRRRNGPRGKDHITFQSPLECSPCLLKDCPRDANCSNSLEVQEATEAVYALLKRSI